MAGVINQFTQQQNAALDEQRAKYHKYIKRLKRDLAEDSGVIARQADQINTQAKEIEHLRASNEQLAIEMRDIEAKLEASEDRTKRLEEKYHLCKTHLNSAIQEQQDLYTRSKKQWEETIEKVRAIEKAHNSEAEKTVRRAEAIREQMMEKVRQTIAQNKSEALELYGKINTLTQIAEEKDSELRREREEVSVLLKKLQDLQSTSIGFEALAAQSKEILQNLEERNKQAEERHRTSTEEVLEKLAAVASRLEELSSITSAQPSELSSIREVQNRSFSSMTAKLDDLLESDNTAKEAASQLSADIERHTGKIFQQLGSQLEALGKQLAEKAEENGMISTLYRRKEAECEKHEKELAMLREATEKQAEQIHELETNLLAMDAAQDDSEETLQQLNVAEKEVERLTEELKSKTAAVTELQSRLNAKDSAYVSEVQNLTSKVVKLAQSLQEKDHSSRVAADQAVDRARREVRIEMERANAETARLLRETEHQRDSLVWQLEKLTQKVHEKEQKESADSSTINSLRESLAAAEAKGEMVTQELTQQSAKLEQLEERLTTKVKTLETELEAAKERAAQFEGESHRRRERMQALVAGLKQWALQEGLNNIDALAFLSDDTSSADGISACLVQALGHMLSRRSQIAAHEQHPDIPPRCDENPKARPGETGHPPQADPGVQTAVDRLMEDGIGKASIEQTGKQQGGDPELHRSTLHHMRRVVIRSPENVPNSPMPPSVDREKMGRRGILQPKSIMKRVTRSTSSVALHNDPDADEQHGAFIRNTRDETLAQGSTPNELKAEIPSNGNTLTSRSGIAESTARGSSGRATKRGRSDTRRSDGSAGRLGRSKQAKIGQSELSAVPKTEDSTDRNGWLSITVRQKDPGNRHQGQPFNADSSGARSVPARSHRKSSELVSQGFDKPTAANTSQVLGPRHPNLRTYGSQKAGESSATAGHSSSQSPLRSQSKSRYWPRSKESQESFVFSQDDANVEDFLLPFPNLRS
ncbi:hypothetical protein VTK56DRAFT_1021 [Thermocarpiscus australiensis]